MADRIAATGVLLVGGASERFGSPKALAPFRGETLAERAWRVLAETCDEVLAVGKAGELELPFPVLDDGAEERAPVFGVIAGLRVAAHEKCVVLPVDCPLVTPELLRELADACAVPDAGPLPGGYAKSMLGALEARVAGGELSLKGVNENVVQADEKLLLNVNTRMDLLAAAIADWASSREDVRAALVVGSQARSDASADRWSDLDVGLFVDEPRALADDASWVDEFGRPVLTFLEPTAFGNRVERRVLYESGEDVDFALLEASAWRQFASLPEALVTAARGYRVLYDEVGLADALQELPEPPNAVPPDGRALTELASDFWYHALWTAKKLRRGEVYTAISCLDGYMKDRVVTLLEWHARALDATVDTWHGGRFLERWADPGALAALERAYAHYDLRDVARALWETIDLFQGLEEETARRLGLAIELDHADLRRRLSEIVRDPRPGRTLSL
ncbi:MAG: aminoglycoside 6-adenylyltransferase [Gaiellaceae bacterium]